MRILVLTSNSIRHKFFANNLVKYADDALIISECRANDAPKDTELNPVQQHFANRYKAELKYFGGNDYFKGNTFPIMAGDLNTEYVYNTIKEFAPDNIFVFGSSIIREPLISILPENRFINLHLGVSPYYRGSGTNFWPFVNKELEYVGSTILNINKGIDTGDIICHVRPTFDTDDYVHSAGCKVIAESVKKMGDILQMFKDDKEPKIIKQWKIENEKVYKSKDFDEDILNQYYKNLDEGMVKDYIQSKGWNNIDTIDLTAN